MWLETIFIFLTQLLHFYLVSIEAPAIRSKHNNFNDNSILYGIEIGYNTMRFTYSFDSGNDKWSIEIFNQSTLFMQDFNDKEMENITISYLQSKV